MIRDDNRKIVKSCLQVFQDFIIMRDIQNLQSNVQIDFTTIFIFDEQY